MINAQQRLMVALDVPSAAQAKQWVETLAPHVGVFKVGLELFVAEGPAIVKELRAMGAPAIFLDLKLHDIPATMRAAARQAAELGVDFLTCHCEQAGIFTGVDLGHIKLLGITVLTSLESADLARMGYQGELLRPDKLAALRAKLALDAGCHGVVCSGHEANNMRKLLGENALVVCPGIRPAGSEVHDQKRVMTPKQARLAGASHIVVGRPILQSADPVAMAKSIVSELE